ncbi:MAG: calcium/sodium antiporter [Petrotogales bacterium]
MISIGLAIPALIAGVLFLYKGSDILINGTAKTAVQLGVSSLIISLIIVAFGTSAPEFAISVGAAAQRDADISLGNIIGSCVANLLLILGIGAIIKPIKIQEKIIKREMPILLVLTLLFLIISFFGFLDHIYYHWIGGIILLVLFGLFVVYFIKCAKKERVVNKKYTAGKTSRNILFILLGIIGVVVGAYLLIESTKVIADFFNIPKFVIAISIVAVGTSLPELVVSVMAIYKNEADIAIGNVLGSNVFNIYLVLGVSALFIPLNAVASLDHLLFLMLVTVVTFPILYTGQLISRKEGAFMLVLYSVFIWYTFFGYKLFF